MIDRSHPTPIHAQISDHLRHQIRQGRLQEGQRLPSVRTLMNQYGASMGTIQRVLRDLNAEGMVAGRRGSGVFVSRAHTSGRPSGELRVNSLDAVFHGDVERVQNDFQRLVPGARIVITEENADVIELSADYAAQHAGSLVDVGELIRDIYGRDPDDPCFVRPFQVEGRSVLMPMVCNTLTIMCNLERFDAAGLPHPSPDWTWEEFIRLTRELTRAQENLYGFSGTALVSLFMSAVWQEGGRLFAEDGTRALVDSDVCLAACEMLRRLNAGCPPDAAEGKGAALDVIGELVAGRLAMAPGSIWFPAHLTHKGLRRWTALPLPHGLTLAAPISVLGFGVLKSSPVQSLAREFLSAAALWEKWPDRLDYVNGLYLHADMERHDAVAQAFLRSLEHGRTSLSDVRPECRSPQQEEALRLLNPALLKVLADREPVAQIMRHARDGMNALLGSRKNGLHDL